MSSLQSVIQPLYPHTNAWAPIRLPARATRGYAGAAWRHKSAGLYVISAVEVAKDKDDVARGPEYHLSISRQGGRVSSANARDVLRDFGMDGAEEDNHVPHGMVRNFWRPVAVHLIGLECACKAQEMPQREDKGDYVWRPT